MKLQIENPNRRISEKWLTDELGFTPTYELPGRGGHIVSVRPDTDDGTGYLILREINDGQSRVQPRWAAYVMVRQTAASYQTVLLPGRFYCTRQDVVDLLGQLCSRTSDVMQRARLLAIQPVT